MGSKKGHHSPGDHGDWSENVVWTGGAYDQIGYNPDLDLTEPGNPWTVFDTAEGEVVRTDVSTDDPEVRLASFAVETNNATHIQQMVLALEDGGLRVETEWEEDGCRLDVYLGDASE